MTQMAAHVICFDRKSDTQTADDDCLVEVTDFTKTGHIEIAFNDRNERCYLRFKLSNLMELLATDHAKSDA